AALGALTLMLVALGAEANVSEVRIITQPEGADVWVGIVHLGTTTREGLLVLFEKPATAIFTIRKAGYVTVEKTVRVTPLWELPYGSLERRPPPVIVVPLQPVTAEAPTLKSEETGERARAAEPRPTLRIPRVSRAPRLEDFLRNKPREDGPRI